MRVAGLHTGVSMHGVHRNTMSRVGLVTLADDSEEPQSQPKAAVPADPVPTLGRHSILIELRRHISKAWEIRFNQGRLAGYTPRKAESLAVNS